MRFKLIWLVFVALILRYGYSQSLPSAVEQIVYNYTLDLNQNLGINDAKRLLPLDSSLKSSDFKTGEPIAIYNIDYDLFEKNADTVAVKSILQPSNYWFMPIFVKGKITYSVDIYKTDSSCEIVGMGGLSEEEKTKLLSRPTPPILINDGPVKYLHFPADGKYNLQYLNTYKHDSRLETIGKYGDSLTSSRKILKYRKAEWEKGRKERESFLREHPDIFRKKEDKGGDK